MVGTAALTLLLAVPASGLRPDFAAWVGIIAGLTATLALKSAVAHADRPLAAAALTLVSIAVGAVGLRRRRDEWVLAAAAGLQLAASLFVWHTYAEQPLNAWLVPLLHANGLVAAIVSLGWHRYRSTRMLAEVPLAVAAGVQMALLSLTLPQLVAVTALSCAPWLLQAGHAAGGIVLMATLLAWLVAADRRSPSWISGVWGGFGIVGSVWLACVALRGTRGTGWRTTCFKPAGLRPPPSRLPPVVRDEHFGSLCLRR